MIGPWAHKYPEAGKPGPAVGFQAEALKWWKHWLLGEHTDVMDDPMLTTYIQDWVTPAPWYAERPGMWVGDAQWPSAQVHTATYALTAPQAVAVIGSNWRSGSDAGMWCSYALAGDYAPDQRGEDGRAWYVDLPVRVMPQVILGFPDVTLRLASNQPHAMVAVRLCDVAPDGSSLLVARGLLNLTHRHGHIHVEAMPVDEFVTVTVRLNAAGHHLRAGHRWRVAVSPVYWPHAWPSPHAVTLQLDTTASFLTLPVRHESMPACTPMQFAPVELMPEVGITDLRAEHRRRYEVVDQTTHAYALHDENDHGAFQRADGLTYDHVSADRYFLTDGDPLSARTECEHRITIGRGAWQTRVETWSEIRCDATHFIVTNRIRAYEGDVQVLVKDFHERIARDGI